MNSYIRKRVSQNRKRLQDGKYDLDLTYITSNLIAMGYPSDKTFQKFIRNQIEKVAEFLNEKHENSYKIFNLCDETDYDVSYFNHMVELIPLIDHNPPKFEQINHFCVSVHRWLGESENNVAIVHCKAGKGRTGTMIACYFIYSRLFTNPFEAIAEFNRRRCEDCKGITVPSQLRYIEYYADYLLHQRTYQKCELTLRSIQIDATHQTSDCLNDKLLSLNIINVKNRKTLFKSDSLNLNSNRAYIFEMVQPVKLIDDVLFSFETKKESRLMTIHFNTFCFLQENKFAMYEHSRLGRKFRTNEKKNSIFWQLTKKDIDIAHKNKDIHDALTVTFEFEYEPQPQSQQQQSTSRMLESTTSEDSSMSNSSKVMFDISRKEEEDYAEDETEEEDEKDYPKVVPDPSNQMINGGGGAEVKRPVRSNSEPTAELIQETQNAVSSRGGGGGGGSDDTFSNLLIQSANRTPPAHSNTHLTTNRATDTQLHRKPSFLSRVNPLDCEFRLLNSSSASQQQQRTSKFKSFKKLFTSN